MNRFKLNRFVLLLVATFLPQACFAAQVEKRDYAGEAKLSDPSTAILYAISFGDATRGRPWAVGERFCARRTGAPPGRPRAAARPTISTESPSWMRTRAGPWVR